MTRQASGTHTTSKSRGFNNWYNQLKARGFFKYVGRNILLILLVYAVIVFLLYLIGKHLVDFDRLFQGITGTLSDGFVIALFFISESFTGMIPVDLFVVWTQKFQHPVPYLALLGILSYTGGVISYGIGRWISSRPRVRVYTEKKLRGYIKFVQKWGGAFIVVAALFPFTPFSLVVIAVTMLKYPFRLFLLYALTRLVRFVLQGIFFFDLLNVDSWVV